MARTLPYDEIVWAREALAAGDTLAEIADICGCELLDVARSLGVYGYRPPSLRWRQSIRTGEGRRPTDWIGGMLREVARARCRAGDTIDTLAAEARVTRNAMRYVLTGLVRPSRRKPFRRAEPREAA